MKEKIMHGVFFALACLSILAVLLICIYLLSSGFSYMGKIGVLKFLTGTVWQPSSGVYGILPMIAGSIYVTIGAVIIGVPIGLLTAIYLARFCPDSLYRILKPIVDLMAGIPSIVYGFFGLVCLVPIVGELSGAPSGKTMLTACIILGIMILPTIVSVSEAAIRAVPEYNYEGALALGATKEKSVFTAVVPAAKSGIFAGIVLGIGRAIGETMAVIMVAGNQPVMPHGLFEGLRTMTANIVLEMGYASGMHRGALIATASVLFIFILIINLVVAAFRHKGGAQ